MTIMNANRGVRPAWYLVYEEARSRGANMRVYAPIPSATSAMEIFDDPALLHAGNPMVYALHLYTDAVAAIGRLISKGRA